MIEAIFELVFEFFGEVVIDLVAALIADASSRGVEKSVRRQRADQPLDAPVAPVARAAARPPLRNAARIDPMLAACGYMAFGWMAGMLSLWLLPHVYIGNYWLRLASLVLAPLASGLVMSWIGSWRKRHDKDVSSMETFAYGFCFAFTISLVRFIWGTAG